MVAQCIYCVSTIYSYIVRVTCLCCCIVNCCVIVLCHGRLARLYTEDPSPDQQCHQALIISII